MHHTFFVPGTPKPEPRPRWSKFRMYVPGTADEWKWAVREAAEAAGIPMFPKASAVAVKLTFFKRRPLAHHVGGKRERELKPGMPTWDWKKPDVDNVAKAVLDALGPWKKKPGIAWEDDDVVCELTVRKRLADTPEQEGCSITIWEL